MKHEISFTAKVRDGALRSTDAPFAHRAVATFEGQLVEVIIRKWKAKRSTRQNSRYWALLTIGAKELGYESAEELHEGVAATVLALPPNERTGFPRRKRTPSLDTQEFGEYMEAVERVLVKAGANLSGWDREAERMERAS